MPSVLRLFQLHTSLHTRHAKIHTPQHAPARPLPPDGHVPNERQLPARVAALPVVAVDVERPSPSVVEVQLVNWLMAGSVEFGSAERR